MPERNQEAAGSPAAQAQAWYAEAESAAARAFEEAVNKPSFGQLLARSAENVAAISRIGSDVADLVLRNLRIAGRADITRLARQLHRNEDKLERVLQEVEQLRDELSRRESARPAAVAGNGRSSASRRRSGSGSGSGSSSGKR